MRILIVYDSSQTFTNTVFEHLDAFQKYSDHEWYYLSHIEFANEKVELRNFQAIFVHYSIRLPLNQITEEMAVVFSRYDGIKGLFIQDEYDHVANAKRWIKRLNFNLVFSVVPSKSIDIVYPKKEFPNQIFINNLTGYAPEDIEIEVDLDKLPPPSQRKIFIGYRGRSLPIKYGRLGLDKLQIGQNVKAFCKSVKVSHDIEWDDQARIYGQKWYKFISSCKGMLGSESGSNIFDWTGNLSEYVTECKKSHPHLNEIQLYEKFLKPLEVDGLMNQISPRIFEMASLGTIMILYEGSYSGILEPNVHYLPLKKNLSNISTIISTLQNDSYIDYMAKTTRRDLIESGAYSYRLFIHLVDEALNQSIKTTPPIALSPFFVSAKSKITSRPIKSRPPFLSGNTSLLTKTSHKIFRSVWDRVPEVHKPFIKRLCGRY